MAEKHQIKNCKYASNFYYNIFYCEEGKYLIQDAAEPTLVSLFQLAAGLGNFEIRYRKGIEDKGIE
jgi:hypothetical protein